MYRTQVAWPYQSSAVMPQILPAGAENAMVPRMDIFETEDQVVYLLEMPGINSEQLEVEIEDQNIRIAAPMLNINPRESSYRYQERPKGQLARIVDMPPDVDPESVTANMKNGLLEIRFRKTMGDKKGKKINVNVLQ
ncbi:MAG: Hsp20/alpha crystallin family protein [Clostridia bacterium]|nr:Hsp20/alpha crystallin family protein [Clostridia bacterium]